MVLCGAAEASSKQLREGGNETSLLTASAAQRCPSVATSYTIQQEELFGLRLQTSVCFTSLGNPSKKVGPARNGGKQGWTEKKGVQED